MILAVMAIDYLDRWSGADPAAVIASAPPQSAATPPGEDRRGSEPAAPDAPPVAKPPITLGAGADGAALGHGATASFAILSTSEIAATGSAATSSRPAIGEAELVTLVVGAPARMEARSREIDIAIDIALPPDAPPPKLDVAGHEARNPQTVSASETTSSMSPTGRVARPARAAGRRPAPTARRAKATPRPRPAARPAPKPAPRAAAIRRPTTTGSVGRAPPATVPAQAASPAQPGSPARILPPPPDFFRVPGAAPGR